jgi:hypothetical protein
LPFYRDARSWFFVRVITLSSRFQPTRAHGAQGSAQVAGAHLQSRASGPGVPKRSRPGPGEQGHAGVPPCPGVPEFMARNPLCPETLPGDTVAVQAQGRAGRYAIHRALPCISPAAGPEVIRGRARVADSQQMYTSINIRGPWINVKPFVTGPFGLSQNWFRRNRPGAPLCAQKCANLCAEIRLP